MAKTTRWLVLALTAGFFLAGCDRMGKSAEEVSKMTPKPTPKIISEDPIILPEPTKTGEMSLEEAIQKRRSRRDFSDRALSLDQASQILWAAQGITDETTGFRSSPSAGALYPLELYLVVKNKGVEGLESGVYHYQPEGHRLQLWVKEDIYDDFSQACLDQVAIAQSPASLVIAAEYERTTGKYGERGKRYVEIEAGHVGQNIYLQAETLGLGTCAIGAYQEKEIVRLLNFPENQEPVYVMPLGYPKS